MPDSLLHEALRKPDCTLDDIKVLLEEDASHVNALDIFGERTLHRVIKGKKCSAGIVKLLLNYGADVNLVNTSDESPLYYALFFSREAEVIELLLENGADVNQTYFGGTVLHVALCPQFHRIETIRKSPGQKEYRLHVLKLLLQKFSNVNKCDPLGRSPLCHALQFHDDSDVIQLLLDAGGRMNACESHVFPLQCYVCGDYHPLKIDIMKRFLDVGANICKVDERGHTPLHLALRHANCSVSAIKFLLDHKGVDINIRNINGMSLLHCALLNHNCKMSIIKFLIQQGVRAEEVCYYGYNALFFAVANLRIRPGIIKSLLNQGCPVNPGNENRYSLLRFVAANLCKWNSNFHEMKESLEPLQLLIKYFLLTNPECHVANFTNGPAFRGVGSRITIERLHQFRGLISRFVEDCQVELQSMEEEHIAPGFTLRRFLEVQMSTTEFKKKPNNYDRHLLLKILAKNKFRLYFEVILAKIGRTFMIDQLDEKQISTEISSSEFPSVKKKFILDYPSVCCVADFLSDNALFNLLQAFRNSDNHTDCCPLEDNDLACKRGLQQSNKCIKRSRINK